MLYIFTGFLYYLNILSFLDKFRELQIYYAKKLFYIALLPLFNLFAFFIRFAGIINSVTRKASWKTLTISEEYNMCAELIKKDFKYVAMLRKVIKRILEKPEEISIERKV